MSTPHAWFELYTPESQGSLAFYNAVFGWTNQSMDMGEMGTYHMLQHEGNPFAGVMQTGGPGMENVPPHWTIYFNVEDVEAGVERVTSNGGQLHVPPMDVPGVGRMAMVADPNGAVFWLFKGDPNTEGC